MRLKILIICICYLSIVATPFAVSHAQTTTASSTEETGFLKTVLEGIGQLAGEETPPPVQSILSEAAEKRLTNLAANITNRLEGLIARLRHISKRIEQRINKQAEAGYDVDQARVSLANANELLATASRNLENIDSDVYRAFRSLTPKENWQAVRTRYISTRDTIRAAHAELKTAVVLLKSASPAPVATTTEPSLN